MIEKLRIVRTVARRMHESYLKKHNLYDFIVEQTSKYNFDKFNMRERIDLILDDLPENKCHCGGLLKFGAINCSPKCTGSNPKNVEHSREVQKNNKVERWTKTQETNLRKYGVTHNSHVPEIAKKIKDSRQEWCDKTNSDTFAKYGLDISEFSSHEKIQVVVDKYVSLNDLSINGFGGMPIMTMCRYIWKFPEVKMYEKQTSGGERELSKFIESLGVEIETNNRTILRPKEVDIVVESHKLLIEYNGVYWHSSKAGTVSNYHAEKTNAAAIAGYSMIHIFEHEWLMKRDIVKSILRSKLGFSQKIMARKCSVKEVSSLQAKQFFEECHIQGSSNASFFVGLFLDESLVSCVSFGKPRFSKESDYELIRYASALNKTVVGGFSKMLRFFSETHPGTIMTYCDLRYSTGKTYEMFGSLVRTTLPGYFWVGKNMKVYSRYQTMKSKLEKLVPDHFDKNKSEDAILSGAGWLKVFDSGNNVYILNATRGIIERIKPEATTLEKFESKTLRGHNLTSDHSKRVQAKRISDGTFHMS